MDAAAAAARAPAAYGPKVRAITAICCRAASSHNGKSGRCTLGTASVTRASVGLLTAGGHGAGLLSVESCDGRAMELPER